jgi:hypothetical protein
VCEHGCAIYENRPHECREFACLWLCGAIDGDQRRRPDQLRVMFAFDINIETNEAWLEIWELDEGASERPNVGYVREKLLKKYGFAGYRVIPPNHQPPDFFPAIMEYEEISGVVRFVRFVADERSQPSASDINGHGQSDS